MKRIPGYVIPLTVCALATIQSGAALGEIYLRIDGIQGSSIHVGHENEIALNSWQWELSQTTDPNNPIVRPITITQQFDIATASLYNMLLSGTKAKTATLTMTKPGVGGEANVDYLRIDLNDVSVTTATSAAPGEIDRGPPTQSFSLNFSSVCMTYIVSDPGGGGGAPPPPTCWTFGGK